jgi:hypothetical protein
MSASNERCDCCGAPNIDPDADDARYSLRPPAGLEEACRKGFRAPCSLLESREQGWTLAVTCRSCEPDWLVAS